MRHIDQETIIQYVTDTFAGIDVLRPTDGPCAGDTFIYYDPQRDRDPSHSLPFATIVTTYWGLRLGAPGRTWAHGKVPRCTASCARTRPLRLLR